MILGQSWMSLGDILVTSPQEVAVKLTKARIDKATYQGTSHQGRDGRKKWSRHVLWDDDVRGFGLRLTPKGRKVFIVSYRAGGRKRQMTIGAYGVLTLQQARDKARRHLAEVIEGRDPLAERQAAADAETVKELAARYLTEHAEAKKKPSSVRNDRQMNRDYVIPKLGSLKVAAVTRQDVAALHHALREKKFTANRVLALLSKMFNLAEKWGLRPDGSNPCRHVERFREERRERYLTPEELARLADALATEETEGSGPHATAAVRLLLLTGCRLREVLQLRWEDVDLSAGLLRLVDSKTGAKVVYLSAPARAVLANLPRTHGFRFVIEGKNPESPRYDLNKPWRRIREQAGLKDVRIHDLRHSFASVGAGLGLSLPMLGRLLGHSQPATTARYAHLAADPMHEAADRIAAELTAAMERKPEAEVIQLERRRA